MGHPNVAGARMYKNAIMNGLSDWVNGLKSPTITGIKLSPTPITLAKGDTQKLTVTASYSDGSTGDASSQVTITSSGPAVTVDAATSTIKAAAVGSATVTAILVSNPTLSSNDVPVTVTAAALRSITLTPAAPLLSVGQSVTMSATGTYSDGTTKPLTGLTWASNAPQVMTVNTAGRITAMRPGTAVITATLGTISASATVTVLSGPPQITSFTPLQGPVGATVTIMGRNFTGTTAVSFGGVAATGFTVTTTQIVVKVPQGARTGVITVRSPLGTTTSPRRFTVL